MSKSAGEQAAEALHNGACQTLTGLHLYAHVLAGKLKRDCPALSRDFAELEKLIDRAREELNEVAKQLR